jgi:hypothetical protein
MAILRQEGVMGELTLLAVPAAVSLAFKLVIGCLKVGYVYAVLSTLEIQQI